MRDKVRGVVIHTTGSGPWRRWDNNPRFTSPFDAAVHIYRTITKAAPHFVMSGDTGEVVQMCPVEYAAWHVGSRGSWRYGRGLYQGVPEWWRERWPELRGPGGLLDGALWSEGSANTLTLGIDVSPPTAHPRGSWDAPAWEGLGALVRGLAGEHGFPVDPYHVFTHSDAHPRARTANGKPWDPGPVQWAGPSVVTKLALLPLVG